MKVGTLPNNLQLTQEEAFALLSLCMTSPNKLDGLSEQALQKLAAYCAQSSPDLLSGSSLGVSEYDRVG